MVGLTQPSTMKLRGIVQGHDVTILIDSRVTLKFLCSKLCLQLALPFIEITKYDINMINGQTFRGDKTFENISLKVQGLIINHEFLILGM